MKNALKAVLGAALITIGSQAYDFMSKPVDVGYVNQIEKALYNIDVVDSQARAQGFDGVYDLNPKSYEDRMRLRNFQDKTDILSEQVNRLARGLLDSNGIEVQPEDKPWANRTSDGLRIDVHRTSEDATISTFYQINDEKSQIEVQQCYLGQRDGWLENGRVFDRTDLGTIDLKAR